MLFLRSQESVSSIYEGLITEVNINRRIFLKEDNARIKPKEKNM